MADGDDLMNLGPFIKNYVFNAQPLHNLSLITKLGQTANNIDADVDDVSSAKSDVTSEVTVCRPIQNNNGAGQSLPYKKRNWDSCNWSPPKLKNGQKYLSEKQTKIKNWLSANYTYCPRQKNAKVSSRGVLTRAVKEFGPLTQKALGFLMYQAFPGVERMKDTRKGHIFKGILDKNSQKRPSSRKDRSTTPPSRPVSIDASSDLSRHDRELSRLESRELSRERDEMEEELDENQEPVNDNSLTDREVLQINQNFERREVKLEPVGHELMSDQYDPQRNERPKTPTLKQESEYLIQESQAMYTDEPHLVALSPVSDDAGYSFPQPAPGEISYPLLRHSLRQSKPGGHLVPAAESYYVIAPVATDRAISVVDEAAATTVFHHHHIPPPVNTTSSPAHLDNTDTAANTGYFKLAQTLPEAHEQVAGLLRYIQTREEKLNHVERQFQNLSVEFQKMAAMLREFHVDQVEFFKKIGYAHVQPSCDGNNN